MLALAISINRSAVYARVAVHRFNSTRLNYRYTCISMYIHVEFTSNTTVNTWYVFEFLAAADASVRGILWGSHAQRERAVCDMPSIVNTDLLSSEMFLMNSEVFGGLMYLAMMKLCVLLSAFCFSTDTQRAQAAVHLTSRTRETSAPLLSACARMNGLMTSPEKHSSDF